MHKCYWVSLNIVDLECKQNDSNSQNKEIIDFYELPHVGLMSCKLLGKGANRKRNKKEAMKKQLVC